MPCFRFVVVATAVLLGGFGLPSRALAQPGETFGTASEIALTLASADFLPLSNSNSYFHVGTLDPTTGFMRLATGGTTTFQAGIRLPAGAIVTRLEIAGCDTANDTELTFVLRRSKIPSGTGFENVTPLGSTGTAGMPGCGRFSVTPSSPPLVIDNVNATYWAVVAPTGIGSSFDSVRVYYQLQVSPAPATATFGDVPTSHPFFPLVEALVASGITAGCGGGNYCPDAALTRGQMAVFLSKALGLHFAP
jgi:S-layer homology domain